MYNEYLGIDPQVLSNQDTVWNWNDPQLTNGPVYEWGAGSDLGSTPIGGINSIRNFTPPPMPPQGGMGIAPMSMPPAPAPQMAPAPFQSSPLAAPPSFQPTSFSMLDSPLTPPVSQSSSTPLASTSYGSGPASATPTNTTPGQGGLGAASAENARRTGNGANPFDWGGLARAFAGPVATLGIGALASYLGQRGGKNDESKPGSTAPAAPPAAIPGQPSQQQLAQQWEAPLPPPTTPTGSPNMGVTEPASMPGSQWSPLLMKKTPQMSGSNVGLEAQKRMRRGGQTGGMALY